MHSHHTIPQSRGGVNSQQIILCSGCHNILHANAVHLVAKIKNPKKENRSFWNSAEDERRAKPWLQILVRALLTPQPESSKLAEHLVSVKLDRETFQLFKILANEMGSQDKALEYCIKFTLSKKGLKSDQTNPQLWFLPFSKS